MLIKYEVLLLLSIVVHVSFARVNMRSILHVFFFGEEWGRKKGERKKGEKNKVCQKSTLLRGKAFVGSVRRVLNPEKKSIISLKGDQTWAWASYINNAKLLLQKKTANGYFLPVLITSMLFTCFLSAFKLEETIWC